MHYAVRYNYRRLEAYLKGQVNREPIERKSGKNGCRTPNPLRYDRQNEG